jgi:hypothetical protein
MTLDTYSDLFDDDLDSVAAVLNDDPAHTDVGNRLVERGNGGRWPPFRVFSR